MRPGPILVPGARPPGPHYSPAFAAPPFVFVSGCVPFDLVTGETVGTDIRTQTECVLGNIATILAEAGCGLSDVVKATVYLTDTALAGQMNEAYAAAFGDHRPARATVEIGPLSRPEFLIEIDAIAWRPEV